jgi:S-adenosylmethionine:tRNA-ribosyltransferase-isomerase (queuine synthetase)
LTCPRADRHAARPAAHLGPPSGGRRATRSRICHVYDLIDIFRPGDRLILNNTKVIPARLTGTRASHTGQGAVAKVEVTLLEPAADRAGARWPSPCAR